MFDAFLAIYKSRTADLLRIYANGTGVLPTGAIHPDLVNRLANEAAKTAGHVLTMCIRALDYVPPVDVTFFEYLRGIITADFDFVPEDRYHYRVAFVEAFRNRGIYPIDIDTDNASTMRTMSAETLRWSGVETTPEKANVQQQYAKIVKELRQYADETRGTREMLFMLTRQRRMALHDELKEAFKQEPAFARELGMAPGRSFEVHELRRASRVATDGKYVPQLIVGLTQSQEVAGKEGSSKFTMRGGSTLVVDLAMEQVKFRIVKHINSESRRARTAAFFARMNADPRAVRCCTPRAIRPSSAARPPRT